MKEKVNTKQRLEIIPEEQETKEEYKKKLEKFEVFSQYIWGE